MINVVRKFEIDYESKIKIARAQKKRLARQRRNLMNAGHTSWCASGIIWWGEGCSCD